MIGRYAPSPTGPLHLGNLRTALLAWLFARSAGSRFALRVDDLDRDRSREALVAAQLADLDALGLDWDGEPVRQSERTARYAEAVARLQAAGLTYPCFCTRAEIREASQAPHGELPVGHYPGTCRRLTAAQRRRHERAGRPPALRVDAGGAVVAFADRLAGPCSGVVDDLVVRRNDGQHAYNLATAVDDADAGVEEVVRGADLLATTPRQRWLAERLGLAPVAAYAHVPLVLGADGARLAKRHGAATLAERRAGGQGVGALRAELAASAGLAVEGEPSPEQLVARFDPDALSREPAVLGPRG